MLLLTYLVRCRVVPGAMPVRPLPCPFVQCSYGLALVVRSAGTCPMSVLLVPFAPLLWVAWPVSGLVVFFLGALAWGPFPSLAHEASLDARCEHRDDRVHEPVGDCTSGDMAPFELTVVECAPTKDMHPAYVRASVVNVVGRRGEVRDPFVSCVEYIDEADAESENRYVGCHHGDDLWVPIIYPRLGVYLLAPPSPPASAAHVAFTVVLFLSAAASCAVFGRHIRMDIPR